MTLIESFDRSPLQNIAECLAVGPDRVILVGNDPALEASVQRYQTLLQDRRLPIEIIPRRIDSSAFEDIQAAFETLIEENAPCAIDLFGGDETYLAAAGAAYQKLKDRCAVTLQQMDMKRGMLVRLDGDTPVTVGKRPMLSVKESVALYGGAVFSEESKRAEHYTGADVEALWRLAKSDPSAWNKQLHALSFFERHNNCSREDLTATVDLYRSYDGLGDVTENRRLFEEILPRLDRVGALTVKHSKNGVYIYRYANRFLRDCLRKAGNILEYKTLFTAREYAPNGERFFNDCRMAVTLDWDGVIYNTHGADARDTRNEIDIMAMRGVVPVFISCKNGSIEEAELYKLNTVARQLGGEFAKKALIATNFEPTNPHTKQSFIQRAKDMGVFLATDAAAFDEEDWHRFFQRIFTETP